ncbi:hypothetical protein F6455_00835 [Proteobacteria bacterium 005FR1]|nr:hypothetical protein [Proteobacteria bacterium 005FR1]
MVSTDAELSEAVLFIEHGRVTREMLYSEFEAILDGVVPMVDFAGGSAKAVYLRIDEQLCIGAAVFFRISFDAQGNADKRWNVPLVQFAENSARGPDLGAGPIRLACHSQCSIAWHQHNLWDPDMTPGANDFILLKKAIKANRLGLRYRPRSEQHAGVPPRVEAKSAAQSVQPPEPLTSAFSTGAQPSELQTREIEHRVSQQLRRKFEQEFRDHMARLLKEQRLRILTLNSKRKQEIQQQQLVHQQRLQEYRHQLDKRQQELELQTQRNEALKETIEGQAKKIEGLREYFEHKLKSAQLDENAQVSALKQNYEAEVSAKVEAATLELKEKLQLREIELMYRREQESSLEEEVRRLREQNQAMLNNTSEQLLEKLEKAGLNFVAYHPGAGHLTIPLADMSCYMDNPTAYAAEKCGVSLNQYRDWLAHYKQPVCQALGARGDVCGGAIERVPTPSQFHTGEHDRCDHHRTSPTRTFAAVGKNAVV